MKEKDAFAEMLADMTSHISEDKQYNNDELEAYNLSAHPEWKEVFLNPKARDAIALYLKSDRKLGRDEVKNLFEKINEQ